MLESVLLCCKLVLSLCSGVVGLVLGKVKMEVPAIDVHCWMDIN